MVPRHEATDEGGVEADELSASALLAALPRPALVLATDGSVDRWNTAAAALLPDERPATFDLLAHPPDRERAREAVLSATEGGSATVSFEPDTPADSPTVTFDCTAIDEDGRTAAILAVQRPAVEGERPTADDAGHDPAAVAETAGEADDRGERSTGDRPGAPADDPLQRLGSPGAVGDGAYAVDDERRFVAVTDQLAAMLGTDRDALVGASLRSVLAGESEAVAVGLHETLLAGDRPEATAEVTLATAAGERPAELRLAAVDDADARVVVGLVRDISDRDRRERQLARHRDQLATLNRISEAVEGVVQGIVESATREGIEETVCERLTDSDRYRSVWVGRIGADGLEPTASAGAPTVFPDSVPSDAAGGASATEHPALVAFRTGEPCVRRTGWADGDGDAGDRQLAAAHGIRATMALPIVHRETPYGVLCLHSPRADAFTDRERAALERLARVVGFAINAADTEQLLHSGATTEVEFRVTGENCFLARLSAATGPVTLRWTVPEDGGLRHFLEVEGPASAVVEAAEAAGAEDVSVVSERDGDDDPPTTILEARLTTSVAARLGDAGAVVQSGRAEGGVAEFTARLAGRADTRTVVETFQDEFEATLTAKRRIDEPVETARDLRQAADERLTDRQADVLRTAYLMGYYEWPRDHTAEEVADRMGITSATLHYHLRAAQRNFLELFFDESPAGG